MWGRSGQSSADAGRAAPSEYKRNWVLLWSYWWWRAGSEGWRSKSICSRREGLRLDESQSLELFNSVQIRLTRPNTFQLLLKSTPPSPSGLVLWSPFSIPVLLPVIFFYPFFLRSPRRSPRDWSWLWPNGHILIGVRRMGEITIQIDNHNINKMRHFAIARVSEHEYQRSKRSELVFCVAQFRQFLWWRELITWRVSSQMFFV